MDNSYCMFDNYLLFNILNHLEETDLYNLSFVNQSLNKFINKNIIKLLKKKQLYFIHNNKKYRESDINRKSYQFICIMTPFKKIETLPYRYAEEYTKWNLKKFKEHYCIGWGIKTSLINVHDIYLR